jgi:hypothetical protein
MRPILPTLAPKSSDTNIGGKSGVCERGQKNYTDGRLGTGLFFTGGLRWSAVRRLLGAESLS